MKKLHAFATLILFSALQPFSPSAFSLEPSHWQYRQVFDIAEPGPVRILVPLETLDRAQSDLRDLRIIGPEGTELPYTLLTLPAARAESQTVVTTLRPIALQLSADKRELAVTLETDTSARLDSVELLIPDTAEYLVPARVEISSDGATWELVATGKPLFRRNQGSRYDAVVHNTISLYHCSAPYVRVTIYDQTADSAPIAITGARLRSIEKISALDAAPHETAPAHIVRTEELPGETLLTIDLGAANLSLTELTLDIADPLFVRTATLLVGTKPIPVRDDAIYRIALDGQSAETKTVLALGGVQIAAKEITLRIENGDSPPLHVRGVSATRRLVNIAFNPLDSGKYEFLSGNPIAAAPRYDLAMISGKFAALAVTKISAAKIAETPNYVAPKPPTEPVNLGARAIFWVALAVVVIVLLVVMAKLLPKPKE